MLGFLSDDSGRQLALRRGHGSFLHGIVHFAGHIAGGFFEFLDALAQTLFANSGNFFAPNMSNTTARIKMIFLPPPRLNRPKIAFIDFPKL